jgi:O-antigen/teichoic acid export membrane protein
MMVAGRASVGRNAGYNLAGSLLPLLLSLLTVPLYLKLVGPDRYGVLAIAWLLLGYFGLFDLGLGRATSYRIAALRDAPAEARAATFWTAIAANVGLGLIGALALWAAAGWFFADIFKVDAAIRPEILAGVPYLALAVPIATLTGVLSGGLQGREQFLRTNSISVASTALFQLFPLAVAWLYGPYLPILLLAAIAARLVAVAALWAFAHAELTRGHKLRIERARLKELLSFGGWVSVGALFGPLLVIADRFLIGAVLGAVAVTLYTIPFQLAQRLAIVPSALTTALFPRLSAAPEDEQRRLGGLAFRTLSALLTAPVLVGVLAFGPFLELWVGETLGSQAAPIGRLLLVGYWANAFALLPYTRLQAKGRPDLVTKMLIAQVPPYLPALYLMMEAYGLIGCAIVFVIRCTVDFFLLAWKNEGRIVGLGLFLANLALLLAAAALPSFAPDWTPLWFGGGVLLALAAAALGYVALPAEIRAKLLALRTRPKVQT